MVDLPMLRTQFAERYGTEPRLFSAPGRVNLIGEHTDYNEGFVMPIAANLRTYVAAAPRDDNTFRIYSRDLANEVSFQLEQPNKYAPAWCNYVYGVAKVLHDSDHDLQGANVLVSSEVPRGAGLSSSAALEIAFGFALLQLSGRPFDLFALATAGQRAEHLFVGTKSGLMDQLTAVFAEKDRAFLIDCRAFEMTAVTLPRSDIEVVICDSKVKHQLANSAYNQRRAECDQAVNLLQQKGRNVKTLRDLTCSDLQLITDLPDPLLRRSRHVITENARTLRGAEALKVGDLRLLGQLMTESHVSLRDDFEVSCRELDLLVELSGAQDGVLGSRMMGGGFGGCTVNLVHRDKITKFSEGIAADYLRITGVSPQFYLIKADTGVREHKLS